MIEAIGWAGRDCRDDAVGIFCKNGKGFAVRVVNGVGMGLSAFTEWMGSGLPIAGAKRDVENRFIEFLDPIVVTLW